jgi:hypothetical protein
MPLQATSGAASYDAFGGGSAAVPNYIEDVFSTWLYTGNGATQTINNGIDLAGKGGLVWAKSRSNALDNTLTDTVRGVGWQLVSNTSFSQDIYGQNSDINGFTATGFDLRLGNGNVNTSGQTEVSWTFRKQPKFFDIVQFTGNGAAQTIPHNLGSVPGFMLVKRVSGTQQWIIYHRSFGRLIYFRFGVQAGVFASTAWNNTNPTATEFTVGTTSSVAGQTYIAYLFAHNAGGFGLAGTDNVISCDGYAGNGSASGPTISLGYEPQWIMIKNGTGTGNWQIIDNMRGMPSGAADASLLANTTGAETSSEYLSPTSTGFQITTTSSDFNTSGASYIYIAIRRGPMKVPTDGTKVFSPNAVSVAQGTQITSGFPVDMTMPAYRLGGGFVVEDRLRGISTSPSNSTTEYYLTTSSTAAESNGVGFTYGWNNTGFLMNAGYANASDVFLSFRRAPGFFDVVCYTGTGGTQTLNHNLGVAPELAIVKTRSSTSNWAVAQYGADVGLYLDSNIAAYGNASSSSIRVPTATTINVANTICNATAQTFAMYLFASCPGVSKVGSYTGTGATQTINCGFTGGSRFVMIKRTDSTGDWYVWDSARGIVAGNDPYLLLNSTAAEVTGTDYVDTASTGFEISSTAPAAINASGGSFIFFAVA